MRAALFRPIEELLETYNVTLETVRVSLAGSGVTPASSLASQPRVDELTRRNRHIQRALSMLERPGSGVEGSIHLWPAAAAMVSSLPTLLHRFLRRGEANDLCRLVVQQNGGVPHKKRCRRTTTAAA